MSKFRVLQPILHSIERKHYFPGDEVNLDHLGEDDQRSLVRMGVVEAMDEEQPAEPRAEEPPA